MMEAISHEHLEISLRYFGRLELVRRINIFSIIASGEAGEQ